MSSVTSKEHCSEEVQQVADDEPLLSYSARCKAETWTCYARSIFSPGGGRLLSSLA
jgi:hypothetical protein